jgi:hypothetical protein
VLNKHFAHGRFHMAIISTKRPERVAPMLKMLGTVSSTWYVTEGEEGHYLAAGLPKDRVRGCRKNISAARNAALKDARLDSACSIQSSDDLRNVHTLNLVGSKYEKKIITIHDAISTLLQTGLRTKQVYGGVALTNNPLNYQGKPVSFNKFVACDLIYVEKSCSLFDESVALKEDYDMTLSAILTHGGVFRCENILCDFPHRDNAGGANTYRTTEAEKFITQKMFKKWGDLIAPHPLRAGQIILNYAKIRRILNNK